MIQIKASEVQKLRKITGAGMMDCKNALKETEGDFDAAIDVIRTKGQAVANKRSDRDANEGAVIANVSDDRKAGAIIVLNCETDFVAKNENFVSFATKILDIAVNNQPTNIDELKDLELEGQKIGEKIIEQIGVVGEKLDLSYYSNIKAEQVTAYIHPGNKLATLVGLTKDVDDQIGKDIAMQIAAMNPISLDPNSVPKEVAEKEFEIGKEMARNEGKPENILDKIAEGRLNKFFKENTLTEQSFIKDGKITVKQYLKNASPDLSIADFKRFSLNS